MIYCYLNSTLHTKNGRTRKNLTVFDLTLLTAFKVTELISQKAEEIRFNSNLRKLNDPVNDPVNLLNYKTNNIYLCIKGKRGVNRIQLKKIVHKSISTISREIRMLTKIVAIEFKGSDKTGGYYLKN